MPTIADVAKRANVAVSTVSYAINGTRPISEETRQRIFAAMDELGYRPNALARGLASKRSRIIALLFAAPERGLGITELEFVTSAADAAKENGYHLVLWSSEMNDPEELRRFTQQGLVDGVVVMEVHLDDNHVNMLREISFPFTMIGRCADTDDISYVDIHFEQTIKEAVQYLAELGHTNIAFLNHSQAEFDAGYGPAVRAHTRFAQVVETMGLTGITRFCRATPLAGWEAFNDLLNAHPDLTALVAMNDRTIPGIMQAIAERGWRIPDDFSLMSVVSSARAAEMMVPPLTTMDPPTAELGRLGVELLIQQLEGQAQNASQMLLPCRLVVRDSSGPCRRIQSSKQVENQ
ncbi:MAG: LacI family DNA-binding transcriptional regulator [Anaerolineales bacterium]|nr:LacI family DNA-binding transcriptional regulator [Anaerolineales bacterium]